VLFLLFGSSCAGKTSVLAELRGRVEGLAVHDFDEIGVPTGATVGWRHRANEEWVRRALAYEAAASDMLLAGQTPYGEILAAPSAAKLEAIAACLLDCDDETRLARMEARGEEWLARTGGTFHDYIAWAAWMRRHAEDPSWRQDVIRVPETERLLEWSRWSDWKRGDPRWRVAVVDTSARTVAAVVDDVAAWIAAERMRRRGDA
jgi:hypothetical protein